MNRLKNNKAFTLVELIVVIAVLGILVLLAAPKLLGYTEDAKLVQIKNDVKVVENALEIELIDDPEYMVNKGWGSVPLETMNEYVQEGSLFDTKGSVDEKLLGGEFYLIEDEFAKTKLDGQSIASEVGKVYYHEDGLTLAEKESSNNNEDEYDEEGLVWPPPENYVLATDADFSVASNGNFRYIGTDEYVTIPHVIKGVEVTSYDDMFNSKSVKGVASDNKNVTGMSNMFYNSKATTLDLSSFDTSNVTGMWGMFRDSPATSLDLSSFDTSKVTSMALMFYGSQATTLDLSSFDTSKVANMNGMFRDSQATELDLSSFDTSNVTGMNRMFQDSQATTLDLSSFDTSNVTNMAYMFADSQVTTLDLSSFDTSNVKDMSNMFYGSQATIGYARTAADASKFNNSSTYRPAGLIFVVK